MRRVASSNEFFDILDKIGNGKFVTIGYVTGANLDVPTVSRRNPLTNRMKKYPDYSVFGADQEIGALVKITSYNIQYLNRQTVGKKYGEYKQSANGIRANFGLDPIASKESYKQGTDWSPNGPELYKGQNADLQSHSYNPQNIFNVKPKGVVYAVNNEGHIIKELTPEQVQPYLKAKREVDGVAALRKMGAEEERIQDYIAQINNLKFKYINFESNSILWIAATINGEKIVYINDNLARAVDGIDIRPEDFRAIARERYQIDLANLQEMAKRLMNKKHINEGDTLLGNFHKGQLHKAAKGQRNHDWYDRHPEDLDRNMNVYDTGCKGKTSLMAQGVGGKEKEKIAKSYRSTINQTKKAANESMNKSVIRLTENDLHNIIENAVKKYLKEWTFSPEQLDDKAYMDDYYAQREKLMQDDWEMRNRRLRQKYPGKSEEWYEAMIDTFYESKKPKETIKEETFQNNQGYSHFAVNKATNKIVNGWDYSDYDPSELRQFKKDYFDVDLIDYDLDPKQYRIVTGKYLLRQGIDPNDNSNWANS